MRATWKWKVLSLNVGSSRRIHGPGVGRTRPKNHVMEQTILNEWHGQVLCISLLSCPKQGSRGCTSVFKIIIIINDVTAFKGGVKTTTGILACFHLWLHLGPKTGISGWSANSSSKWVTVVSFEIRTNLWLCHHHHLWGGTHTKGRSSQVQRMPPLGKTSEK